MARYKDKKAVVVGGTIGMGLATVKALLEGGAEVVLTGTNEKNLEAARRELGPKVRVVRSDITSRADIDALGRTVEDTFGRIDFVFINAGSSELGPFERVSEVTYDRIFAVNTKGAFFTAQRLASLIQEGGSIVFTTVAEGPATANLSVYAGAKAAVRTFAQVMTAELAPRGIRVNAVGPGFIKTPTMGVSGLSDEEKAAFMKLGDEITPLKRHGTAEEVARAALFLAFEATFTTGIELAVDGGLQQIGASL